MKRRIYSKLLNWKKSQNRKPLILEGARQIGKTWIMKEFGRSEYKKMIYINCEDEPRVAPLLSLDFDIERIVLGLQAISGIKADEETLIILDEIQEVPRGLTALKYFYEKAPQLHVMVAGSLLGITLHQGTSFPVGKVDLIPMHPMDYLEFLDAVGQHALVDILLSRDWELMGTMHNRYVEYLRQYYFVGGMPEVVKSFVEKGDLSEVRLLQNNILSAYRNDTSKHAATHEVIRINQVLDSIPVQLAKENKKFAYGNIKKGSRSNDYETAIQWLKDSGIIHQVTKVDKGTLPLKFYENPSSFKLYMSDCGLLGCMANAPADQMLIGENVFVEFKGAFTEQFVLQQLTNIDNLDIHYWTSKADAELDFLIQQESKILPIEVKAETNVKSRSLHSFITNHPDLHGIRISMSPYKEQDWMTNYPLYAISAILQ
ncbi:MAG: ATP-binding protein [Bacteroidales bacterium]|nr:ATP-binding protein [Candidatus Colimorpha onthohippi]